METKPREPSPTPSTTAFGPSDTLELPRRRQGPPKRKSLSGLSSFSPAAKRLAKERNSPHALLPPFHNGPVTRARQSPAKLAAAAAASAVALPSDRAAGSENGGEGKGGDGGGEEDGVEECLVDEDFESVRSRGKGVHVVPTHAGWFSWKKVHPLEERNMASFFNGNSENRTCDIYMETRNSIMKKFRADPQTQIEQNDLTEMSTGDPDARQEIMEFLDHWGLINFHPLPLSSSDSCSPETDGAANALSLLEKLYQFETVHAPPHAVPKRVGSPIVTLPRLLSESTLAEDPVRPEEPSVEYHCNSCSGDCSRKRYHCQKRADFDLCSECYSAEKFGPGMVSTDFILMESAEARGVTGGSWTDQETLLLLEALELYGENWNEIREHVATKTKAQCILHFVQMPIEDPFLEGGDALDDILPRNKDPVPAMKESAPSNILETTDTQSAEKGDQAGSSSTDPLKRNDDTEAKVAEGSGMNIVTDALKTAFQSVGSLDEQGEITSFAEAGNPVMALAAFLAGLVEPNAAEISTRSSLKSLSEESPGIQLAARHCFLLEDPPNVIVGKSSDSYDPPISESEVVQKVENHTPLMNGSNENEPTETKVDKALQGKKELPISSEEYVEKKNVKEHNDLVLARKNVTPNAAGESGVSLYTSQAACSVPQDSGDLSSPGEAAVNVSENPTLQVETASNSVPSTINGASDLPGDERQTSLKESEVRTLSENAKECLHTAVDVDTVSTSVPPEEKSTPQMIDSCSAAEIKNIKGKEDVKVVLDKDENNSNLDEPGDGHNLSRIKRAAITALSAAAVKAKIFAEHEEAQIRQLVSMIIEKQLQKLENKLAMFMDIETVVMRVREHLDRARKRLYHERAQIIAARFGVAANSSRPPNMASHRPPFRRT